MVVPLQPFTRVAGELCAENVPLRALATRFGTPLWIHSANAIRDRLVHVRRAFAPLLKEVHYSVKANSNLAILKLLADAGAGFDVVSGGEIERCLRAGIDPARLVFAGVGKTDEEIELGLRRAIGHFDVESRDELARLAKLARAAARRARFALRLNPDVDAGTHAYVTTGLKRNKFGLPFDEALAALREFARHDALEFRGFHVHIGSQITDAARFRAAAEVVAARVGQSRAAGFEVATLNFGGGFAAQYDESVPPIEECAAAVWPLLAPLKVELLLEPGRYLVAEAGLLLTRVITVKNAPEKSFVVVDAAMNDLIRPALYQAQHPIEFVVAPPAARPRVLVDVVGPVCESGDFLARDRAMTLAESGELLAILSAGAYGSVMSSNYNTRCRAAEVLVDGGTARLIRRRETIDDVVGPETLEGPAITLP